MIIGSTRQALMVSLQSSLVVFIIIRNGPLTIKMMIHLKKSSQFFFCIIIYASTEDRTEFTLALVFQCLVSSVQKQLPKLIFRLLLMGAGCV